MVEQLEMLSGIIIGLFIGTNDVGEALVAFADNPKETAMPARSTIEVSNSDIGKDVALMFENGDLKCPLIIGFIQKSGHTQNEKQRQEYSVSLDDEEIILSAKKNITLKCGKSSITLTSAGKILIKGTYLSNSSTGVNRIRGGSIQLN